MLLNSGGVYWISMITVSVSESKTWIGNAMHKIVFASILNEAKRKARAAKRSVIAIA